MFDTGDKRTRDTVAPRGRFDIQPFEEHDRRAICAVDVVDPFRRFNEAYRRTILRVSKTYVVSTCQRVSHFAEML